jgi:intein/homing endonuclease
MGLIKKKIAKALADILHDKLNVIGKSLDVINKNLNATKDDEHRTSFNVIWDLLMKKADKTKPKKKPTKRFKITTKAGSELIDWTSAHSMLEQEKEIDEKAVKDFQVKGWRSAAFDLDSRPPATPSKA